MAAILRTASGFCSHALPSCVQARMPLAPAASAARPSSDHASFKSTSCPGVSCSRSSVGFRAAGEEVHHSGCWTPAEKAPDSHGSLPQRGFRPGIGAKAGQSNGIKTTCSFGPGVCSRGSHIWTSTPLRSVAGRRTRSRLRRAPPCPDLIVSTTMLL
jgi:hypothetical protein